MRIARVVGCARSGCGRCRLRRRRFLLGWWGRSLDLMLLLLLLLLLKRQTLAFLVSSSLGTGLELGLG